MNESEERLTTEYLWKIGNHVSNMCPAASRYFMFSMQRRLLKDNQVLNFGAKRQKMFCHHCGTLWFPGNHRVRIQPCPVPSKSAKKLLRHQRDQPWNLSNQEKKKISSLQKSSNKIVYTCFKCQKRTVFPMKKKVKISDSSLNSSALTMTSLLFKTPKNQNRDVNAGLFIFDSTERKVSSNGSDNFRSTSCEPQSVIKRSVKEAESSKPHTLQTDTSFFNISCGTPTSSSSTTPVSTKTSGIKQKKHSLLCKVLQKETKKSKSKGSLALFLNSL